MTYQDTSNQPPMPSVGWIVKHAVHGMGVVRRIDEKDGAITVEFSTVRQERTFLWSIAHSKFTFNIDRPKDYPVVAEISGPVPSKDGDDGFNAVFWMIGQLQHRHGLRPRQVPVITIRSSVPCPWCGDGFRVHYEISGYKGHIRAKCLHDDQLKGVNVPEKSKCIGFMM